MTANTGLRFGITGAHGYLGSSLAAFLRESGHEVIGLVRRISGDSALDEERLYRLGESIDSRTLEDLDVLVHCAYDFSLAKWAEIERVNVGGTAQLLDASRRAGIERIVLISTISAFDGCKSMYGRAKLEMEKSTAQRNGIAVRPGLLYGRYRRGLFNTLAGLTLKLPVVPLVGYGDQPQYLAHVDDVSGLVLSLAQSPDLRSYPRTITAANPTPYTLRRILQFVAKSHGLKRFFLPVPSLFIWGMLRLVELVDLPLGFRSDSIVSLGNQDPDPIFPDSVSELVYFRNFEESYHSE